MYRSFTAAAAVGAIEMGEGKVVEQRKNFFILIFFFRNSNQWVDWLLTFYGVETNII